MDVVVVKFRQWGMGIVQRKYPLRDVGVAETFIKYPRFRPLIESRKHDCGSVLRMDYKHGLSVLRAIGSVQSQAPTVVWERVGYCRLYQQKDQWHNGDSRQRRNRCNSVLSTAHHSLCQS